ncbi:MAG: DNA phosphorothioation-associated protein 4 [Verrucomicrobiales bacterium]
MKNETPIWDVAAKALDALGGKGTLQEIFEAIVSRDLYDFGTEDPSDAPHVLDTELKRKCSNSTRTDKSGEMLFELNDGLYRLLKHRTAAMTEKKTAGTKRIHRARDKEEIIAALLNEQVGVFKEIWRLLLFAAQVGMQDGRREPLSAIDSGKGIDQSTFGNCPSWPGVCHLMSLVEMDSSEALTGSAEAEDLRLAVFQEYANGGLSILQDYFQDRVVDLAGVLSFIDERSKKSAEDPDLDLAI